MTQLTDHFSLDELTASSTATRLSIDNTPPLEVVAHLTVLAMGLEKIRVLLGSKPLRINSGYRCPQLNRIIGGAPKSAHITGYAADFVCQDFGTPVDIVRKIQAAGLRIDQCIQEGTWVHISFDPAMRGQFLIANFAPGQPTTYTAGVA